VKGSLKPRSFARQQLNNLSFFFFWNDADSDCGIVHFIINTDVRDGNEGVVEFKFALDELAELVRDKLTDPGWAVVHFRRNIVRRPSR